MDKLDVLVIGAGVIGLSAAAAICRKYPQAAIAVLDKEQQFGWHTSSRNSEVIHGGMYYPAQSLKAQLCVEGRRLLYSFCQQHAIPCQAIGKLILARSAEEEASLETLYQQGQHNQVEDLALLSRKQVQSMEPHIQAVSALYSPHTGILDSHQLMAAQAHCLQESGNGFICYRSEVLSITPANDGYQVCFRESNGSQETLACTWLINAAGLWSDRICSLLGMDVDHLGYRLEWVKGEYFSLPIDKGNRIKHLVYPPPLKHLKGLGIHVTKTLDGRTRMGPSAFSVSQLDYQVDSGHDDIFYQAARSYLPFLLPGELAPDMAGIRPKRKAPDSEFRDFVITEESAHGYPGFINLVGIESPGLTASLAIGQKVLNFISHL